MLPPNAKVLELTPTEFEEWVEGLIRRQGLNLENFQVSRLETISASDGDYEIDVTVRFQALGGNYLLLIECKHHKNAIKREVVQILFDKIRALGAQKGMIFSIAGFQRGAIEFAEAHGISLVTVTDGKSCYHVRSENQEYTLPPEIPSIIGWVNYLSQEGNLSMKLLSFRGDNNVKELLNL